MFIWHVYMRGSRGGVGGGPDPPWNLQCLISPILLEMRKLVIFSYLCIGPPLEKFSGSAPAYSTRMHGCFFSSVSRFSSWLLILHLIFFFHHILCVTVIKSVNINQLRINHYYLKPANWSVYLLKKTYLVYKSIMCFYM